MVLNLKNRSLRVETPSGTIVEYIYGPLGRRMAKVVNGQRSEYRYDGEELILEMNDQDSIITSYTFGLGIDQPLKMHRNGFLPEFHFLHESVNFPVWYLLFLK